MKKIILSVAFVLVGTFAMAQQTTKMERKSTEEIEQKKEERMKQMKEELGLSDAQIVQLKALQEKRMAERKGNQAERKAKMEEMKTKREDHEAELRKILTPEQYKKWEAKRQEKIDDKMKEGKKMKHNMHKKGNVVN